jgi:ABC-2 type transport system ATP-binding protein
LSVVAPERAQPRLPAPVIGPIAVRISQLCKSFHVRRGWVQTITNPLRSERMPALTDVSLEVREGEFFGLLGPNGAGKTTLFKILSTLILPDAGRAEVGGYDVKRDPVRARQFLAPVISEERSLNWRLSAFENLRIYAALQGLRGSELRARIAEVLDLVELADTGDKMVGQFSSGMKQRLLIARALLARPRILLLDEPTRALDPISARRFRRFLREEIADRQGCTVLLATHNAEEAIELCDRVGVLNRGRLLRVGSPDQLMEEYRDEDYRLWIHSDDWPRFAALARLELGVDPQGAEGDHPDWTIARLRIHGGPDRMSELIAELVRSQVRIAGAEPIHLSLADLIERIVEQNREAQADV